jgi:hypothetical protein
MMVIISRNDEVRQLSVSAAERLAEITATSRCSIRSSSSANLAVLWPACVTSLMSRRTRSRNAPLVIAPVCNVQAIHAIPGSRASPKRLGASDDTAVTEGWLRFNLPQAHVASISRSCRPEYCPRCWSGLQTSSRCQSRLL